MSPSRPNAEWNRASEPAPEKCEVSLDVLTPDQTFPRSSPRISLVSIRPDFDQLAERTRFRYGLALLSKSFDVKLDRFPN